ncbi:hypothetical protein RHGRI_037970 [Rhododendron griersonianum]|uniref:Uncharacterized protein n=1 Tax=Rhododendron griersonianum TaxID=479676 RepID=A0AAV6HXQ4_9ERIC|nr:hypothetical protein RHGRI_037970 [Rhododendron griersonianum]
MGSPLEADSCIMVAEHELDIKESEGGLTSSHLRIRTLYNVMGSPLEADSCIMVAEHELDIKESEGAASSCPCNIESM